jgi:hypothetical protein
VIGNAVVAVARAAAEEIAPRHGSRLTAAVEAAIHADGGHQEQEPTGQYTDPVALGALIVAIAQFGYQVYTDRKGKGQQPISPPRSSRSRSLSIWSIWVLSRSMRASRSGLASMAQR